MISTIFNEASVMDLMEKVRHDFSMRRTDVAVLEKEIKTAIEKSFQAEFNDGIVEGYQALALLHMQKGDPDMAYNALILSEAFTLKLEVSDRAVLDLYNTFMIYYMDCLKDTDKAILMCKKALSLADKTDDQARLMKAIANLGMLSVAHRDYGRAESYLDQALTYYESQEDDGNIALCIGHLGLALAAAGRQEVAVNLLKSAGSMAFGNGSERLVQVCSTGLRMVFSSREDVNKGIRCLEDLVNEAESLDGGLVSSPLMLELTDLYLLKSNYVMAESRMGLYDESLSSLSGGHVEARYYRMKSEIAAAFGDQIKAQAMQLKYDRLCNDNAAFEDRVRLCLIA